MKSDEFKESIINDKIDKLNDPKDLLELMKSIRKYKHLHKKVYDKIMNTEPDILTYNKILVMNEIMIVQKPMAPKSKLQYSKSKTK